MYYRVGITYAPKQTNLPALDAGFIVRRTYTGIDDPADVTRAPDGRWKIRLGARVQVTLEAINTTARYAVALVDPMPAGLESVNESLATSERAVQGPGREAWDHVAMRDNRSEAFSMSLAPGRHQFSYTARAATPGTFLAAPAKAEEMYSPETFGRSIGSTITIE
jgi:alpha-2-macroglobulin